MNSSTLDGSDFPKPIVRERSAYDAGACQGCGAKHGTVFEINARGWITRFCMGCLSNIVMQAKAVSRR